jgi:FAD/FMN-containing dehydrogenase
VLFEHLHGAAARVGAAETAFGTRGDSYHVSALSRWLDPAETDEQVAWARRFADAIEPWSSGGVYVNYLSEDEDGRVRGAFLGNYERLAALKRRYDPTNFFRVNQNIAP